MARLLSVERKWVVTGTPTTHLLGLSFGGSSVEEFSDLMDEGETTPEATSQVIDSPSTTTRRWTRADAQDLNKLATMMTHFIAVPMFNSDTKRFYNHVVSSLMERSGPAPGAVKVLTQVMEMVMIRHRIEDVEKDVVLPPIKQEVALLDLDIYAMRSYNALQASIAINAIDSERKDQDYMFHPRNADSLQELVQNISQVLFYGISSNLYNTAELVRKRDEYIQRSIERGASQDDLTLIQGAFEQIQLADADASWRETHDHEDVPYRVFNLDEDIFRAWTRTPSGNACYPYSGMIHCDRLLRVRDEIVNRPLMMKEDLILHGKRVDQHEALVRIAIQARNEGTKKASQSATKRKATETGKTDSVTAPSLLTTEVDQANSEQHPTAMVVDDAPHTSNGLEAGIELKQRVAPAVVDQTQATLRSALLAGSSMKHSALAASKSHVERAKVTEVDRELQIALEKQEALEATEGGDDLQSNVANTRENTENIPSVLLQSSLLAGVEVGSSASSKLDFVLKEVTLLPTNPSCRI
jgi:hypothetical protein